MPDASSLARGWRSGRPPSPWANLPPLQAPPGVTTIAGQALTLDGRPLPDVTLALEVDGAHRPDRPVSAASAHREEEADLILPNGSKIHYVRISPSGLPCYQTVFEHTTTPTAFYKSRIAWNGNGWDLTLVDGTVYVFGHAAPPPPCRCSTATHSIA